MLRAASRRDQTRRVLACSILALFRAGASMDGGGVSPPATLPSYLGGGAMNFLVKLDRVLIPIASRRTPSRAR
jgi:hypothetical protein